LEGRSAESVAFSRNGNLLAAIDENGAVTVWDTAKGKKTFTFRKDAKKVPVSVMFRPDGALIAVYYPGKTIKMWDVTAGKVWAKIPLCGTGIRSGAFSPDGKTLALGYLNKTIRVLTVPTGKRIGTFRGHTGAVVSLTFSPDGKTLASAANGPDKTLRLWNVVTGKNTARLPHPSPVSSLAFSPNGKLLASGSTNKTVRLWEVAIGKKIATFKSPKKWRKRKDWYVKVKFSPDSKQLGCAAFLNTSSLSALGELILWNVGTRKQATLFKDPYLIPKSFAFRSDGKLLALGIGGMFSQGKVRLWAISY
jgi:WD40 repeat protein